MFVEKPKDFVRMRRLRTHPAIRSMVQETHLLVHSIIAPLFITDQDEFAGPISTMPGIERYTLTTILPHLEDIASKGIDKIALFPLIHPHLKSPNGDEAWNEAGLIPRAIATIRHHFPDICIFTDIALDPYTSHGHDGIVIDNRIDNDKTLEALTKQAICHAHAGADYLAPSDMMDGRITTLRKALDAHNLHHIGLLSYAVKFASSLYSPFRDAIQTSLSFGDKKTYQMNPANTKEAIREALIDVDEGADMLMVKPALSYLDIISRISNATDMPTGAYHVSGEYAMVMAAHKDKILDGPSVLYEHLLSIKRSGAQFIYTYAYNQVF